MPIRKRRILIIAGALLVLALLTVSAALAQTQEPCVFNDGTPASCVRVRLSPENLGGDVYVDGSPLFAGIPTNTFTSKLPTPGTTQLIEFRNISSPGNVLIGSLYVYQNVSKKVVYPPLGKWQEYQLSPVKKYIRGQLSVICDIKNITGEDVRCALTIDGEAKPDIEPGGESGWVVDNGSHVIVVSLIGAQASLWSPASQTKTVTTTAGPTVKKVTMTFKKAGHLIANLDKSGVVGDWYLDGSQIGAQVASIDQWVTPDKPHKVEVKNLVNPAQPLIHPWKDGAATATVTSGKVQTVTVKAQIVPANTLVRPFKCGNANSLTTNTYIGLRVGWRAISKTVVEDNISHITAHFTLDGQDLGDISAYRLPAVPMTKECGPVDSDGFVIWWIVPLGKLAAGEHTYMNQLFLDAPLFDGWDQYDAGPLEPGYHTFTVAPAP